MPVKVYLGNKAAKISKSIRKRQTAGTAEAQSTQPYVSDTPAHLVGVLHLSHGCSAGLWMSSFTCGLKNTQKMGKR